LETASTNAAQAPLAGRALKLHERDGVAVALADLSEGERVRIGAEVIELTETIPKGHKFALRGHDAESVVTKYGAPIGLATARIERGTHVHVHNLRSALGPDATFHYEPQVPTPTPALPHTFRGYVREDGRAATRNELWILPTVGCVARTADALARSFAARVAGSSSIDGVHAFGHAFGCSQLGSDLENTQKILARLATHPNAGGVLVLGLGCENNHLEAFRPFLAGESTDRIRFLSAQSSGDEHEDGLALLTELAERADRETRVELPASRLCLGLKCGGSDGLSGITANPLLGRFTTRLSASGGSAILTEVPEMFGAEAALFRRSVNEAVFARAVSLVTRFRRYYADHGQPVYENPAPGNKAGGITTLEEKSLGCVQKGGDAPIRDVIAYGERARSPELTLLEAPGNDQVSTTALVAAGATLVLFTTGRGTPLGSPVPTVKVSTNSELAQKKPGWIDFDAGSLAVGGDPEPLDAEFAELVFAIASGQRTRNELNDQRDIGIFKSGVML
jgi:altronate hydrolase